MMIVRNLAGHRRKKTFFVLWSIDGLWGEIRRTWSAEQLKTKQLTQAVLLSVGHRSHARNNIESD